MKTGDKESSGDIVFATCLAGNFLVLVVLVDKIEIE